MPINNYAHGNFPPGLQRVIWPGYFSYDDQNVGGYVYHVPLQSVTAKPALSGGFQPNSELSWYRVPAANMTAWPAGAVLEDGKFRIDKTGERLRFKIDTRRGNGALKTMRPGNLEKALQGTVNHYLLPTELLKSTKCLVHSASNGDKLLIPSLEWLRVALAHSSHIAEVAFSGPWDNESVSKIIVPEATVLEPGCKEKICLRSKVPDKAADLAYQLTCRPKGKEAAKYIYSQLCRELNQGSQAWLDWAPPFERKNYSLEVYGIRLSPSVFLGLQISGLEGLCDNHYEFYRANDAGKNAEEEKLKPLRTTVSKPTNFDPDDEYTFDAAGVANANKGSVSLTPKAIKDLGMRMGEKVERDTETQFNYHKTKDENPIESIVGASGGYSERDKGNLPVKAEVRKIVGVPRSIRMTINTLESELSKRNIDGYEFIAGPYETTVVDNVLFSCFPESVAGKRPGWVRQHIDQPDVTRVALVVRVKKRGATFYLFDPWPRANENKGCLVAKPNSKATLNNEQAFIRMVMRAMVAKSGCIIQCKAAIKTATVSTLPHRLDRSACRLQISSAVFESALSLAA
jgi:hypothetical protein